MRNKLNKVRYCLKSMSTGEIGLVVQQSKLTPNCFSSPRFVPTSFPGCLLFTSRKRERDVKRRAHGNEFGFVHGCRLTVRES